MNTSTSKTVIRLSNEVKLATYLLSNIEITKTECSIRLGDPQINTTASRLNIHKAGVPSKSEDDSIRWIITRKAPEKRRDGSISMDCGHYFINPRFRLQILDFINHQRQGQQLPPLELPPLPNYPEGHPAWQLVKKGGAGHVA